MNAASNYILTLKLNTEKYQENILNKRLEISRSIYNSCLGELFKRYNHMRESKEYEKVINMVKGKERNKKFNELNKRYNLTEYSFHKYVKCIQKYFKDNVDSFTAQKIASRCFSAFQKLMLHQSNRVYFKKYGEMNSVEGKSNKTGIRFIGNKLRWNGLDINVIINKNDEYAQVSLLNKTKYCRVVRKLIRGKYKYYVQLILEGIPPIKYNKETGEVRNKIGDGKALIDIGTRTIAISSKNEVKLLELCPEVENIEHEKNILLRKLDRQRRSNNPNNYNENGTIKKGVMTNLKKIKLTWIKSNKYIKTQNELREVQRKQAYIRKQSHEKLANYIISLGDRILVETMNYKGLQLRVKETTVNTNGKFNKKKRFGKSLANKAPAMLLTILDNKLKWHNTKLTKINTYKVKASQYNHIEDKYVKKKLSERWNDFGEFKIQRDLYSSFLIMNVKDNLEEIDKELCFKQFDNFRKLHDKEILKIQSSSINLISSMGI
ncbi:transposase [Clostridium estertheticum]|uniref:transposase n=1 Tax=Clostridium estertheticum TaxID=238834 RepID=UPI001CF0F9DA|nr:transposase [Clostridium estertheticum]MCB2308444.1 transposase [Clostridium estertheticum]